MVLAGMRLFRFHGCSLPAQNCYPNIRSEVRNMNNCKNRQRAAVAAAGCWAYFCWPHRTLRAGALPPAQHSALRACLPALFPFFVVCELLTAAPPPADCCAPCSGCWGWKHPRPRRLSHCPGWAGMQYRHSWPVGYTARIASAAGTPGGCFCWAAAPGRALS